MAFFRGGLKTPEVDIPEECVGDAFLMLSSRPEVLGEAEIQIKVTCQGNAIGVATPVDTLCVPRGEVTNQLLQSRAAAGSQAVAAYCRTCPNNPANAGFPAAASIENAAA